LFKVKTKYSKEYEEYVKAECFKQGVKLTHRNVKVNIIYQFTDYRKHDIDNVNKVLLDALEGLMFTDDNNIYDLHCTKQIKSKPAVGITMRFHDPEQKEVIDYETRNV
tara:strand:- start:819 stop:1142 length:324 start_codon:yes stop_codon:yes gene_type:complete